MAYLDTRTPPSPAGIAAVVALHGAVAAALILGLSVSGVLPEREIFTGIDIPRTTPPPPTQEPPPQPRASRTPDRKVVVPLPPIPFPTATAEFETTQVLPTSTPSFPSGGGEGFAKVLPTPTPSFAAVAASPRSDPRRWVTTEDYRSNWVRQDMTGRARFRLEIAADGRVAGCTITASSGHAELDAATCALVSRRAKFQPARGTDGAPVAGSYSNTIDWQLPE